MASIMEPWTVTHELLMKHPAVAQLAAHMPVGGPGLFRGGHLGLGSSVARLITLWWRPVATTIFVLGRNPRGWRLGGCPGDPGLP